MNAPTTYEILIAQKTALLPVPDMADSIWARIEVELDAPAADPVNKKQPKQKASSKQGAGRLLHPGIVAITAAAITLLAVWLFNKKKKTIRNKPVPGLNEERKNPVLKNSDTAVPYPVIKRKPPETMAPAGNNSFSNEPGSVLRPIDNGTPILQRDAISNDSQAVKLSADKPVTDPLKTVIPSGKPGGVKGLSDSDYKIISVKKDSVKGKE